jgi:hypothetical protein
MRQEDTAVKHSTLLLKGGRGLEHQSAHSYSHVSDRAGTALFAAAAQGVEVVIIVVVVIWCEVLVIAIV